MSYLPSEINAAIAERLFGWVHEGKYPRGNWVLISPERKVGIIKDRRGLSYPGWPKATLPDYAGTWEGAGMVLEAMRARGWDWEMHHYSKSMLTGMRCTAGVSSLAAPSPYAWWAEADTLPRAVAEAAMAALEAE